MAKMIAVIGSPGSGKITVTLKLAQELYCATTNGAVIYCFPSLKVPAIGVLFPNYTPDSIFSLGEMLDKTDIYEEDILNHLVTVKSMNNFGCLGYKAGENRFSYPVLTEDKVKSLFDVLHKMAGYVFVDCTEEENDLISQYALGVADEVILVLSPDLKSMVYLSSNESILGSHAERAVRVLNINENELYPPVDDVKSSVRNISFVLPYSKQIRGQHLDGLLYERAKDKKYRSELSKIVNTIM
ncbi:MAG: hypothetical protein ACI4GY_01160 [Acutalibacteraceae bacterium]